MTTDPASRTPARLAGLGLAAALALVGACGEARPEARRPHLLLISLDTLRADRLEAHGYERPTAPHLADLARDGALFEQCIAVANWTLPTHVTMLTGLHPLVHGVVGPDDALSPDLPTLAEALAREGYRTAGWHSNPFLGARFGYARGFAAYASAHAGVEPERFIEPAGEPAGAVLDQDIAPPGLREEPYKVARSAELVTDRGLAFLDEAAGADDPFFLFLHYNDCHSDYIPPRPYDRRFGEPYGGDLTLEGYSHNPRVHPDLDPAELAHIQSQYDGEIAWVDSQVGRLVEGLAARGLAEDTLVVVTADHGEGFFEHGDKEHHYGLFDELVHVPWLLRFPGRIAPDTRIPHLVSQADVTPTLLELLGAEPLPEVDGISWAESLRGGRGPDPRPVVSYTVLKPLQDQPGSEIVAVRTPAYTIIGTDPPRAPRRLEVFDRRADPDELRPVTEDRTVLAAGRDLLLDLRRALEARRALLSGNAEAVTLPDDPELLQQMRQWGYIK